VVSIMVDLPSNLHALAGHLWKIGQYRARVIAYADSLPSDRTIIGGTGAAKHKVHDWPYDTPLRIQMKDVIHCNLNDTPSLGAILLTFQLRFKRATFTHALADPTPTRLSALQRDWQFPARHLAKIIGTCEQNIASRVLL